MSNNLVTEARVEVWTATGWWTVRHSYLDMPETRRLMPPIMSPPEAVEEGRACRRYELQHELTTGCLPAAIRVVDSAGTVVQQWGRT